MKPTVTTYQNLSTAAAKLRITRPQARELLRGRSIMIRQYEGRSEIAAGLGVSEQTVKYYVNKGKLRTSHVGRGRVLVAPVGQFNEQDVPGWPDVPRKIGNGPRMGALTIVPHRSTAPKKNGRHG